MLQIENLTKGKLINHFHSLLIVYSSFGWLIPSQRINIVLLIPTIQYQFLVNDNMCLLTQLENVYKVDDKKNDSFIGQKLSEYGIEISDVNRGRLINTVAYMSFCISYIML